MERKNTYGGNQGKSTGNRNKGYGYQQQYSEEGNFQRGGNGGGQGNFQQGKKPYYNNASGPSQHHGGGGYANSYQRP